MPTPANLEQLLAAIRAGSYSDREMTSLPTFGGAEPESGTSSVWSWDESRLLVGSDGRDMRIVSRDDWGVFWDAARGEFGRRGGSSRSEAKAAAARANGKRGGRPPSPVRGRE